jgi:hypothetical protein
VVAVLERQYACIRTLYESLPTVTSTSTVTSTLSAPSRSRKSKTTNAITNGNSGGSSGVKESIGNKRGNKQEAKKRGKGKVKSGRQAEDGNDGGDTGELALHTATSAVEASRFSAGDSLRVYAIMAGTVLDVWVGNDSALSDVSSNDTATATTTATASGGGGNISSETIKEGSAAPSGGGSEVSVAPVALKRSVSSPAIVIAIKEESTCLPVASPPMGLSIDMSGGIKGGMSGGRMMRGNKINIGIPSLRAMLIQCGAVGDDVSR